MKERGRVNNESSVRLAKYVTYIANDPASHRLPLKRLDVVLFIFFKQVPGLFNAAKMRTVPTPPVLSRKPVVPPFLDSLVPTWHMAPTSGVKLTTLRFPAKVRREFEKSGFRWVPARAFNYASLGYDLLIRVKRAAPSSPLLRGFLISFGFQAWYENYSLSKRAHSSRTNSVVKHCSGRDSLLTK